MLPSSAHCTSYRENPRDREGTRLEEHTEPRTAPDGLQRPLVPRSRFQQQVSAGVRFTKNEEIILLSIFDARGFRCRVQPG